MKERKEEERAKSDFEGRRNEQQIDRPDRKAGEIGGIFEGGVGKENFSQKKSSPNSMEMTICEALSELTAFVL